VNQSHCDLSYIIRKLAQRKPYSDCRNTDGSANAANAQQYSEEYLCDNAEIEKIMVELDNLVGLDSAKHSAKKLISLAKLCQERKKHHLPQFKMMYHLVFTGNPGTGKTTVARIIGRIYKALGILKRGHVVEVERADLVAGFLGQTSIKTRAILESAVDGVLFIDEACALSTGDDRFGNESVNTMLKFMEDHRDRVVVIAAGYPKDMELFLNCNPGFRSRFKETLYFQDYTEDELIEIFCRLCEQYQLKLARDAYAKAAEQIRNLPYQMRGLIPFGRKDISNPCALRISGLM
jgi:SpoVK/Ycf46/Vps4 family AAA+-type ATPase